MAYHSHYKPLTTLSEIFVIFFYSINEWLHAQCNCQKFALVVFPCPQFLSAINNNLPRDNYSNKPQLHAIFLELLFCRILFWYSDCLLCSENKSELNNRPSIETYRECIKVTSTFPNKHIAICHPCNSLWRQRNFSLKKWSRKNQSLHLHWLLQMCCCKGKLVWERESELL